MEKGFYHPQRGYWQTTGDVPKRILDGYPAGTIEVSVKPSADHVWQDGAWVEVTPDPAETLTAERTSMVCTPLQGILTLGETEWAKVITYRDTQATWAEKVVIDSALDWRRTSQNIAFFGYLLGYTDTQMDDLFRLAMTVEV